MKLKYCSLLICIMLLLTSCGEKLETTIYFFCSNEIDHLQDVVIPEVFPFEANHQKYEVMSDWSAENIRDIGDQENDGTWLYMLDEQQNIVFTYDTGETYPLYSIHANEDIDGKVYIMYYPLCSDGVGISYYEDYVSSHILELDIKSFEVKNKYDFEKGTMVITVQNGYAFFIEDGRVYRMLLSGDGEKECMADLGYRGLPQNKDVSDIYVYVEENYIKVTGCQILLDYRGKTNRFSKSFMYTDSPIESE